MVGTAPQRHDIVPPLLYKAADDALDAVTDEVATHLVGLLLWVLYRYMIWKPRMKARRAGGLPASPTMKSGGEASSNEASADEAKRLFAAIKAK